MQVSQRQTLEGNFFSERRTKIECPSRPQIGTVGHIFGTDREIAGGP
jgi:hypothetical protein